MTPPRLLALLIATKTIAHDHLRDPIKVSLAICETATIRGHESELVFNHILGVQAASNLKSSLLLSATLVGRILSLPLVLSDSPDPPLCAFDSRDRWKCCSEPYLSPTYRG